MQQIFGAWLGLLSEIMMGRTVSVKIGAGQVTRYL